MWYRLRRIQSVISVLRVHGSLKVCGNIPVLAMADKCTNFFHPLNLVGDPEGEADSLIETCLDEFPADEDDDYDFIFSDDDHHDFEEPISALKMSGRRCPRRTAYADLVQVTVSASTERRNRWSKLRTTRRGFTRVSESNINNLSTGKPSDETLAVVCTTPLEPELKSLGGSFVVGDENEWLVENDAGDEEWCKEDEADEPRLGLSISSVSSGESNHSANEVSDPQSQEGKMASPCRVVISSDSFDAGHQEEDKATAGSSNGVNTQTARIITRKLKHALFMPPPTSKTSFEMDERL